VVLFGAIPSIALGLVSGIDRVPPSLLRAGRVLGTNRLEQLWYIVLPAALPGYVSGLRLGWAFAWRSLMAAELIIALAGSPSSLGQLLDVGRKADDMSIILAVIVVILAVGVAIESGVFGPLERRLLRSRGLGVS
jgi:NitT/TauT family transport system permease protein